MAEKNFEDTIFDEGMPVNSRAALRRLDDILEELNTNCLKDVKDNPKVRRMMWFLNQQVFEGTINLAEEWHRLLKEFREKGV